MNLVIGQIGFIEPILLWYYPFNLLSDGHTGFIEPTPCDVMDRIAATSEHE